MDTIQISDGSFTLLFENAIKVEERLEADLDLSERAPLVGSTLDWEYGCGSDVQHHCLRDEVRHKFPF